MSFCPLSAIVTVSEDGEITVDGKDSEFVFGILPPETKWSDSQPKVISGSWKLDI